MKLATLSYQKEWSEAFPEMDSPDTCILVFGAPEFFENTSPILALVKAFPQSTIVGCSSAGEIMGRFVNDGSLSVAIIQFEKSRFTVISEEIISANESFTVGKKIASQLDRHQLQGIFVLSDGLHVNGSELVKGLNTIKAVSENTVVTGGLAGDGSHFKRTWTLHNGNLAENRVVAIGFFGDSLQIGHGSQGGWDPFGPERRITRSEGNVLYELDRKPALVLYKEYLGERASGLPSTGLLFPLAIRANQDDTHPLVRTILAVNEENQSLTFAGDIPQDYLARLMRANFDRLVSGANRAAELAHASTHACLPMLAIAISCVGRRLVLGERIEEETESTLDSFPEGTQLIGFYSYGEIAPFVTGGACDLHNQTMTITTLSEI